MKKDRNEWMKEYWKTGKGTLGNQRRKYFTWSTVSRNRQKKRYTNIKN